jgi:H+/Cl- antiporter ClcA
MRKWFSNNKILVIGILLGSISGFLYWKFIGCTSGKCAIKSNPYLMIAYGGLMGGLIINLFKKQNTIL